MSDMTEESAIQCDRCGTVYSDLEEICPYCGQPRPDLLDDDLLPDEYYNDFDAPPAGEPLPSDQEELLFDDDGYPVYENEALFPEEAYLPDEGYPDDAGEADDFVDDDIFAVAGDDTYEGYEAPYEAYGEPYEEDEDLEAIEEEGEPRRLSRRRLALGCVGIFLCIGLFYGGIGLLGAYHGLQERTQLTQLEAEAHYQRGQAHLADDSLELAIAEFELALSLNPNLLAAREALRDAQRLAQIQPTPTSETRSAAAAAVLATAETHLAEENWAEAVEMLINVRDLDPDYQPEQVSDMIYQASYQLGRQLTTPDQIEEAVVAFETALSEQPDNPKVTVQLSKALAYIDGQLAAENDDLAEAVDAFKLLYQEDPGYLDVKERLLQQYEAFGEALLDQEAWCRAQAQFVEASLLEPSQSLTAKTEMSAERCQEAEAEEPAQAMRSATRQPQARATASTESRSAAAAATATPATTPTASAGGLSGTIYFSAFNPYEEQWEILSVPARGGSPELVTSGGIMPAVSPNGQLLVYRSEVMASEGFHVYDLATGEDKRITILRQHVLPRWGGDSSQFLLAAQEPATGRWRIHLGFADGKSDPIILRDGRTPAWSPDNQLIAYQGADAQGNNPGIYIVPFDGGEETRLTNHESDRAPAFSPDGSRLAYMSTRSGNWDIFTISVAGSTPRQITTNPSQDGLPTWSPDGSHLAYVSDAGGSWAIYTIPADGGGSPTKVTAWDGLNRPDWLLAQIWWAR